MTEHAFGNGAPFSVGLEEELLLVDAETHALAHVAEEVLPRMELPGVLGRARGLQRRDRAALGTARLGGGGRRGAARAARPAPAPPARCCWAWGVHPSAALGDVRLTEGERYRLLEENMRGLVRRTPEGALHVHVGMPDAESAIRAYNGLREHLPLLQGLSANSPVLVRRGFRARERPLRAHPRVPAARRAAAAARTWPSGRRSRTPPCRPRATSTTRRSPGTSDPTRGSAPSS